MWTIKFEHTKYKTHYCDLNGALYYKNKQILCCAVRQEILEKFLNSDSQWFLSAMLILCCFYSESVDKYPHIESSLGRNVQYDSVIWQVQAKVWSEWKY